MIARPFGMSERAASARSGLRQAVVVSIAALAFCGSARAADNASRDDKTSPSANADVPTVRVVTPKTRSVSEYVELTGNAASINHVDIVARVEGYLEKVHFRDGQIVRKGDLLFTIQQAQYRAQLAQTRAQIAAEQAALDLARKEWVRYSGLRAKGAAAEVIVDKWAFEIKKSEATIAGLRAQEEIGRLNLDYTEVRAPFDGQMSNTYLYPGATVGGAGQRTVLAEIMQINPIYAVANVSEQELISIRKNVGQLTYAQMTSVPIDVGIAESGSFPYHGHIQYVSPSIDAKTGTLFIRGVLANPDRAILPGFFLRIRLPKGKVNPNAMLIPERAILSDQTGRYLLVVNADDVVEKRNVQTGELVDNLRVIASGINADDRIVVGELWRAAPGAKVDPKLVAAED